MADYDYQTVLLYNISGGIGGVPGSGVTGGLIDAYDDDPGTATDAEPDNTFTVGDTFALTLEDPSNGNATFNVTASFAGTINLNGVDVPVVEIPVTEFPPSPPSSLAAAYPNGVYGIADWRTIAEITATTPIPSTLDFATLNTAVFTVCFLGGTEIATPDGPRAVDSLSIGDPILTADGDSVPVKWLGHQTVTTRFAGRRGLPVRIAAGALGPNLPVRDLCVTQDHALLIDGLLVNAGAMLNGTTVTLVDPSDLGETFTVYHIETEGHRVIVAEGAATETFIDYVERSRFDNYDEFIALYGEPEMVPELGLPRISTARHLPPALRARLGLDKAA